MKIFFSGKNLGFYFDSLLDDYKKNDSLPKELIEITLDEYKEFQSQPPNGMQLGSNGKKPVWVAHDIEENINKI